MYITLCGGSQCCRACTLLSRAIQFGIAQAIPQEVIDKDYGCGDPSPYVKPGDVVLDLGSGGGSSALSPRNLSGPGACYWCRLQS